MSLDLTDDNSTLVQVMAWCRQATGHYLSQCWPRSMSPYGVTRPQWVQWNLDNQTKFLLEDFFFQFLWNGSHFVKFESILVDITVIWFQRTSQSHSIDNLHIFVSLAESALTPSEWFSGSVRGNMNKLRERLLIWSPGKLNTQTGCVKIIILCCLLIWLHFTSEFENVCC